MASGSRWMEYRPSWNARPAIGREQRHPDRMQDEHERGHARRAPAASARAPRAREATARAGGHRPTTAIESIPSRTATGAARAPRRASPVPEKTPDEPALDLGRRGRRQRRPAVARLKAIQGARSAPTMPAKIAVRRGVIGRPSQTSGTSSRLSGRASTARPRSDGGRRVAARACGSTQRTRHEQRGERRPPSPTARPRPAGPATARSRRRRARAPDSPSTATRGAACKSAVPSAAAMPSALAQAGACPASANAAGQQQRPQRRRRAGDGRTRGCRRSPRPRPGCARSGGGSTSRRAGKTRATAAPAMRPSAIEYTASAAARDSATHAPSTSPPRICTGPRSTVSCARRERRCSRRARPPRPSGST